MIREKTIDKRHHLIVPGDREETIDFCVNHFITVAQQSIDERGSFKVALSGGSTPKAIYQQLSSQEMRQRVDWKHCWLFWSDERAVSPMDPESNYHMAMEAGLKTVGIPPDQIFRMAAETDIASHASTYENSIKKHVGQFDLVMLGMGDDGHTASLFPGTDGLHVENRLAIANYIPQKKTWRMTLTYDCINQARHIVIYILGESKAEMVRKALTGSYQPDNFPIQKIGTAANPAQWICDDGASADLL